MKILTIASLLLLTANSFGATLFSVQEVSGFVMPQHRFSLKCEISTDSEMTRKLIKAVQVGNDWVMKTVVDEKVLVSDVLMQKMEQLLEAAAKGKISTTPAPCDIGTTSYVGMLKGVRIPLSVVLDCGTRERNSSEEAATLVNQLKKLCQSQR